VLRFLALLDATAPMPNATKEPKAPPAPAPATPVLTTPGPQPTLESGTKTKASSPAGAKPARQGEDEP